MSTVTTDKTSLAPPKVKLEKGFYKTCEEDQCATLDRLLDLDPSPPEHVQRFHGRSLTPNKANALYEWAQRASIIERHAEHQAPSIAEVGGLRAARVKDFYGDLDSAALFPAFVESQIQAGRLQIGYVDDLTFMTEPVDSNAVTSLYIGDSAQERSLVKLGAGATLPAMTLTTSDTNLNLYKYGRTINAAYETIANQRLDVMGTWLQRIGTQIGRDETDSLLDVIVNGDGSGSTPGGSAGKTSSGTAGALAWSDFLSWYYAVNEPYEMDVAVAPALEFRRMMNLAEFKDPLVAESYRNRGLPSPLNIRYIRWETATGSTYDGYQIAGVDTRDALKKLTWGTILEESANIIDRGLKQWAISYWVGFQKWNNSGIRLLDTVS